MVKEKILRIVKGTAETQRAQRKTKAGIKRAIISQRTLGLCG